MNPLIKIMAGQAVKNTPGMEMIERFNQFRRGWTKDSAQTQINEMLRSGQITQQQLEQAKQMAEQFRTLFYGNQP